MNKPPLAHPVPTSTDSIEVEGRHRALNPDKLRGLMGSMAAIGLRVPISVAHSERHDGALLVAGHHRLEAARRLGWDLIDVVYVDDLSPLDRELWEIDENLCRAELTQLERDQHVARRKEIWEERAAEESGKSFPTLTGRGNKGFASDTAEKTGQTKRAVNQSVKRGKSIAPEAAALIADTPSADKGVELDALASLTPDEQVQAAQRVKDGTDKSIRDAVVFIRGDTPTIRTVDPRSELEWSNKFRAPGKPGSDPQENIYRRIRSDLEHLDAAHLRRVQQDVAHFLAETAA